MIEKFNEWFEKHQAELTDKEKEYLKENIRLKRKVTRAIYHVPN